VLHYNFTIGSLALPLIPTKWKKCLHILGTSSDFLKHDHVTHSWLCTKEILCQDVHVDIGQTSHAVGCQMQSLSGWTASLPLRLSLPDLLFMEGDDVKPPSTTSITTSQDDIRLRKFYIWTMWWPFLGHCYFARLLRGGLTCEHGRGSDGESDGASNVKVR
jgi:hypothetical protein